MSVLFCPLFGLAAVFHACKVRPLLNTHNYLAAAYHSTLVRVCAGQPVCDAAQAKKHSINGIVYGLMFLVLFLALHSSGKAALP